VKYCNRCKTPIPRKYKYCDDCREEVRREYCADRGKKWRSENVPPNTCNDCGAPVGRKYQYCDDCRPVRAAKRKHLRGTNKIYGEKANRIMVELGITPEEIMEQLKEMA